MISIRISEDLLAAFFLLMSVVVAAQCPDFGRAEELGKIESDQLKEISGIAASRLNPEVIWAHNDSGDANNLYTLTPEGKALGVYEFQGAEAEDWEDMAIGPVAKGSADYLYVGDIGDNAGRRDFIRIYIAREPKVESGWTLHEGSIDLAIKMAFKYPDGPGDAETLLVDPRSGDLYILKKSGGETNWLYRKSAPHERGMFELERIGEVSTGGSPTGGDISPNGRWVLIRKYFSAQLFEVGKDGNIAAALLGIPCKVMIKPEPQGESITFSPDSLGFYTVSEGEHRPIHGYRLK